MKEHLDAFGRPNSVYPCTKYLTFGPWIYMVPQYRPESVLMLGYAGGTAAGLIRIIYGDVPITAVDIEPCENVYGVTLIQVDAEQYVKTCGSFDCVIVDLFKNDDTEVCGFVMGKGFVENLKRIARYIVLSTGGTKKLDVSEYRIFKYMGANRPASLLNTIYYFANGDIPGLHIR